MKFISHIDPRLSDDQITEKKALKLYYYHIELYGENSCTIEYSEGEDDGCEYEII
jgi:hypothetical protein